MSRKLLLTGCFLLGLLVTTAPACSSTTSTANLQPASRSYAAQPQYQRSARQASSTVRCAPRSVKVCAMTVATN